MNSAPKWLWCPDSKKRFDKTIFQMWFYMVYGHSDVTSIFSHFCTKGRELWEHKMALSCLLNFKSPLTSFKAFSSPSEVTFLNTLWNTLFSVLNNSQLPKQSQREQVAWPRQDGFLHSSIRHRSEEQGPSIWRNVARVGLRELSPGFPHPR